MHKKPKAKTHQIVTVEKPKHAEEHSLEESSTFTPWKIDLVVELYNYDVTPITYTIFLKAPSPFAAQSTAYKIFMYLEHTMGTPDGEFPRVSTEVESVAHKLDDKTYNEFWKEAQSYEHIAFGDKRSPSAFRFAKPGWRGVATGKIYTA